MAVRLQSSPVMGKRERAQKKINRLQLRREVIRVLASNNLAQVYGGRMGEGWCGETDGSGCMPSVKPTDP